MIGDYFRLSLRSLSKRKTRTYLTMIGIFIGIAAVVSLIGLGEGLRNAITSQFGFLGTDVLSVQASGIAFAGPPGQGVVTPLEKDLTDKIARISGVEAALNRFIQSGTFEFNDIQDIGFTWNVPGGEDRKTFEKMLNLKVDEGRLLKEGDRLKAVVGNDFRNEDRFGKGLQIGNKINFEGVDFEIIGFMEKKGSFIFDSVLIMNEDVMLDFFRDDDTVNVIAVKVKDQKQIDQVQENIEQLLRKERDVDEGEEDFVVQSPQSALQSLDQTLFAVQLFVTIIAAISLLVGGIGIMNTMYTAVLERTKEIGIMKSIGARNSDIFTLYFIESGLLGLVGGLIGVGLGLALAYGLAAIGKAALGSELIQASVSLTLVFGALLFSIVIGLIAGVYPAYQASKKNPVDSLRFAK